jgi:hypothetical protein
MGMGQYPGLSPPDGGSDEVRFGPSRKRQVRVTAWLCRPLAGRLALGIVALAALAVAAFVVMTARHPGQHRPGVTGPAAVAGRPRARPWWVAAGQVVATGTGHRLLGVRGGWELFGTGPGVLIRIQWAAGRVTRTAIPALQSTGPVFFVVGPHQAIIRPLDVVPGYLVPDDQPARALPTALGTAGQAFPGPRPGQVWVQSGFGAETVMSLVTASGARIGPSIRLPADVGYGAVPDGRGYLAVDRNGAAYDAGPGGFRRVAAGTLAAAGPSAWLVVQCPSARHCAGVVVNPATGTRRVLPGQAAQPGWPPGITSPDGQYAAVLGYGPDQPAILHLINLSTGSDRRVAFAPAPQGSPGLAWSPDSRWLFAATQDGALAAIDPRTGQVRGLGVPLPPVTYLAVRSTGSPPG